MNGILAATLMVGGTGLLIGILLGIAGKKFYVIQKGAMKVSW